MPTIRLSVLGIAIAPPSTFEKLNPIVLVLLSVVTRKILPLLPQIIEFCISTAELYIAITDPSPAALPANVAWFKTIAAWYPTIPPPKSEPLFCSNAVQEIFPVPPIW